MQSNNLDAIASEDYDVVDQMITIQPSETQKLLFVNIRADAKVENNEQFILLLTTDDNGVTIEDNSMTITIRDDDGKYVTSNSQLLNDIG